MRASRAAAWCRLTSAGWFVACAGAFGQGAVSIYDEQARLVRSGAQVQALAGDLFGDRISLYSGALEFVHTDFSLPGNNALPVGVGRRLVTGQARSAAESSVTTGMFGDWDLEIPRMHGVFATGSGNYGWTVSASAANRYQRCTLFGEPPDGKPNKGLAIWWPYEFWSGNHLYLPGAGSEEVLTRSTQNTKRPSTGSWPLVTRKGWQLGCLPTVANPGSGNQQGEAFLALAPDGTQYRFDWLVSRSIPSMVKADAAASGLDRLFRAEVWLLPSQIKDRFGNTVTYTYNPAAQAQLQAITSSDGRAVSFAYHPNSNLVKTASDGSRTWSYEYVGTRLSRVVLPDGSSWSLALDPLAIAASYAPGYNPNCDYPGVVAVSPAEGTLTHPSGAVGRFATESRLHARAKVPKYCLSTDGSYSNTYSQYPQVFATRAVTRKTLTGPGLPGTGLRWDYTYPAPQASWSNCTTCVETKAVEVTDPTGTRTRHTFGTRFAVSDGQLLRLDEGWNGSSALRSTTYRYRASDAGPYPSFVGLSDQFRGDPLQFAYLNPLDRRVVTQQGVSFEWQATVFDDLGRARSVIRSSSLGDSRGENTVFYDHLGKWVLGQVDTVTHAGTGLVMEDHDYDGATANRTLTSRFGLLRARYGYYGDGSLYRHYDPAGRYTEFASYRRGTAQTVRYADGRTESAVVNNLGAITSLTNGAGTTTHYGYDAMGRLASVTPPGESNLAYHPPTIQFEPVAGAEYGLAGGHWRQTVSTGTARTVRYFDALWRPRLTRSVDTLDEAGTARLTVRRWDADNRLVFESTPQRSIASVDTAVPGTAWSFDALGRVLARRQDSELGMLTTSTAYLSGFQRRETNARGKVTTYGYQALDTPSEEALRTIAAPEGVSVTIARDAFGKPTSISRSGSYGGGSVGATRRYVYDAHQRLCKTIEPETGATVQAYDSAGNVAWRASGLALPGTTGCDQASVPAARKLSHGYDARNRPKSTSYGDGSAGVGRSYTGDGLPDQVWSTDGGTWTYAYNNRRLLIKETLSHGAGNEILARGVDAYGHLAWQGYPDGSSVSYAPNALGEPTQVSGYASGVHHHPNGAIAGYTLASGVAHSSTQNARGLPALWRDAGVAQDADVYDGEGNVTAIVDQQDGVASRSMAYDALDRLTVAHGAWGSGSYGYDPLDNLRSSTVGSRTLVHQIDPATQRLTALSGSQTLALAYDANGNLSQRGSQAFIFDIGNRLRSASNGATYVYDGHGRRLRATDALGQTRVQAYGHAGQLLWSRHSSQGQTCHVYLGNWLIAESNSLTGTTYVHTDVLGSPVARSNAGGQVTSRTRYEPYGATAAGANPTRVGFTGHVNDADTGLVYMQQRYYDPVGGKFLSVDPVTTNTEDGGGFNRYAYAKVNPYRFKDPDGRWAEDLFIGLPSLAVGSASLMNNVRQGDAGAALVDAIGMVADTAAIACPALPVARDWPSLALDPLNRVLQVGSLLPMAWPPKARLPQHWPLELKSERAPHFIVSALQVKVRLPRPNFGLLNIPLPPDMPIVTVFQKKMSRTRTSSKQEVSGRAVLSSLAPPGALARMQEAESRSSYRPAV